MKGKVAGKTKVLIGQIAQRLSVTKSKTPQNVRCPKGIVPKWPNSPESLRIAKWSDGQKGWKGKVPRGLNCPEGQVPR